MRRIEVQKDIRGAMQLLTQAADGDAALLYACAAAAGGTIALKTAADTLRMDEERTQKAARLLVMYGLGRDAALPPPRQARRRKTAAARPCPPRRQKRNPARYSSVRVCRYTSPEPTVTTRSPGCACASSHARMSENVGR